MSFSSSSSSAVSSAACATATRASRAVSTTGGSVAGGAGVLEDAARANAAASGLARLAAPQCSGATSAATVMRRSARSELAFSSSSPAASFTAAAAAVSRGSQFFGQQLAWREAAMAEAEALRRAGWVLPTGSTRVASSSACVGSSGSAPVLESSPSAQHAAARTAHPAIVDESTAPGAKTGRTLCLASVLVDALPPWFAIHLLSAPYATSTPK